MKAFILAAGRGQRLKPITDSVPKPLVEVQGKALLLHHLLALKQAGFKDIVINVSWLAEQIIDFIHIESPSGLRITISDEREQALETGGGMLKALTHLGSEPFLSVNADVYSDIDYKELSRRSLANDLVHLVLIQNPKHNTKGDFGYQEYRLTSTNKQTQSFTYSGVGIFSPQLFETEYHRINTPFRVVPLIHRAIEQKQASAQIHPGLWTDVGTPRRLAELNRR